MKQLFISLIALFLSCSLCSQSLFQSFEKYEDSIKQVLLPLDLKHQRKIKRMLRQVTKNKYGSMDRLRETAFDSGYIFITLNTKNKSIKVEEKYYEYAYSYHSVSDFHNGDCTDQFGLSDTILNLTTKQKQTYLNAKEGICDSLTDLMDILQDSTWEEDGLEDQHWAKMIRVSEICKNLDCYSCDRYFSSKKSRKWNYKNKYKRKPWQWSKSSYEYLKIVTRNISVENNIPKIGYYDQNPPNFGKLQKSQFYYLCIQFSSSEINGVNIYAPLEAVIPEYIKLDSFRKHNDSF